MAQPDHAKANGAKPRQEMISGAYLRNAWYVAAWSDGVADGQLVPRTIMDEPIVLYRKADGAVAAIEDRCAHRFAPLSMGKIVGGDRIQCPYHGLEFDSSGACVRNPHGTKNIPPRARVKSYPVIEKHKAMWMWMGDGPADEAQSSRLRRARQRAGAAHHQARQHRHQGQLSAHHRQPARPQPHLLSARRHSGQCRHRGIGDHGREGRRRRGGGRHATNSAPPGMFAQFWPNHPPASTSSPRCAGWRRARCGS